MPVLSGKKTFGAGRFFGTNNVTAPTPARFGIPQDMSIDFKQAVKELYGENKFAQAVAAGEMSVTGKVAFGETNSRIFKDLLFSTTGAAGQVIQTDKEPGTVPASVSYIVTVVNSATFTTDLGVINADTGKTMTRVASAPTTGQYSVTAGVYIFAAADASAHVLISYLSTQAGGNGETVTLSNTLQGPAGAFTSSMVFPYGAEQDVLTLNNCVANDTGLATKQGDYTKPTFGFMCAVDGSGNLGTFSFAEAA